MDDQSSQALRTFRIRTDESARQAWTVTPRRRPATRRGDETNDCSVTASGLVVISGGDRGQDSRMWVASGRSMKLREARRQK